MDIQKFVDGVTDFFDRLIEPIEYGIEVSKWSITFVKAVSAAFKTFPRRARRPVVSDVQKVKESGSNESAK